MPVNSIKSLLSLEVEMEGWDAAEAAASSLESTLSDLGGGVTIDVELDAPDISALEDLNDTDISPTIDVQESEDTKGILDGVNFLVALEKIKLIIDVVGTAVNFVADLGALAINPFLDVEDAVARINAQTGTAIPDLDQLIRDLQAADLGESVEQIADVAIHAQQIGAPMRAAAEAALTFTHTFDENPETVLDSLNTLVTTHLVPNLQEAADLMTVFFQQGGNVGGDALAVVNSNAQSWADMSLTAAEALSTIDSLQQGTGATATEAAKMLQTFDDAMTAAAADPASEQANILRMMGITNPKDAGEAIGNETIDGFATAFDDLASDQQDLVSGLFFGKGGKKFTGAIEGMTTQNGIFANVVDAAALAATEIDNSLRGAIDDFVLEINTSIARLLSSDELDLPGKIADLKEAFQSAAETLASGGSIGDAMSVGFHIEGVDTALTNIERIFGNLIISLLEIVAFIQDPLGTSDADKGTRAEIATRGQGQLAFDLKVANADEFQTLIDTAVKRGVSQEALSETVRTALDELTSEGNIGQVVDLVNEIIGSEGMTAEDIQLFKDKYIAPLSGALDEAVASGDFGLAKKIADANNDPTAYTDAIKGKFGFDAAAFDSLAADFTTGMGEAIAKEQMTDSEKWFEKFKPTPETTVAIQTFGTDVDTAMTNASLVTTLASDGMILALQAMEDGVISADEQIALSMTGNTITASFEAVEDTAVLTMAGVIKSVQSVTPHILQLDALLRQVAAAAATVQNSVNTAVAGAGAGGGGGGNTTNVTVTQNNNVQSNAQAASTGYQLGAQIRGMG